MGLLTDPSDERGKFIRALMRHHSKISIILYVVGFVWFCVLASPSFNNNTYFSENALLPGLVKSMYYDDREILKFYEEIKDESEKHYSSIPYAWLLAKFHQLGLDAYTHNFTVASPINPEKKYSGKNVYGILRALKASSNEALVLSIPYRPPSSVYPTTIPSIAIALAFLQYARKGKYWAKDIIFLITDHEQLGMQAWLEAYHGVISGTEGTLDHGDLDGRSGAIQGAINLELHGIKIGHIDIKIEGLNGQLPNLDLFNLVCKICAKEGILYTLKGKGLKHHTDPYKEWWYHFKNMMSMVATQATCSPNGNHGLFLRYGIQALTLEGFDQTKGKARHAAVGRVIEGIFRSMNNLLEKFHQSFFFYILPSTARYISIGLYMPPVCLMAAALIVKGIANWCLLRANRLRQERKGEKPKSFYYVEVTMLFVVMHGIGALVKIIPELLIPPAARLGYDTENVLFGSYGFLMFFALLLPLTVNKLRRFTESMSLFYTYTLLELGTAIIAISMTNFSLGMFCATVSVPFALLISPTAARFRSFIQKLFWILVNPIITLTIVIFLYTAWYFPEENFNNILYKGLLASHDAIIYGISDSMIYGNWIFTVVSTILLPNWLCFWYISCGVSSQCVSDNDKSVLEKKNK